MQSITPLILSGLLCVLLASFNLQANTADEQSNTLLRFAVLGDAEPKPKAEFPGLAGAVDDLNRLHREQPFDVVLGVGDIAHKGTLLQYEAASIELERLQMPFHTIMGNEEHGSTPERFLEYARRWNAGQADHVALRQTLEYDNLALLLVSPDHGRDFDDQSIDWMRSKLRELARKPVFLVVHAAPAGTFAEHPRKGANHPGFSELMKERNLRAVISGDLHMDMDRVQHSHRIGQVHHLHIPGLERTKIPDESRHSPMFRLFSIDNQGLVRVETVKVGAANKPLPQYDYLFMLNPEINR